MDLTVLDWVLFGVMAFLAVVGLFRGFSGQLGSLAGMAAALTTGYFAYAPILQFTVAGRYFTEEPVQKGAAALAVFILGLIAFGIVRRIVARFVSFLVPQPTNAIVGALAGLLKSLVIIGLFAGSGLIQTGRFSEGFFASRSSIVRMVGSVADMYVQGAAD